MPLGCNGGYVIDADFREGNEAPAGENLEFIKACAMQLPVGVKFDRFRADSASYQAEIFNYCDKENILFTVSGQKDKSVMYGIENIKADQWERLNDKEQVAEFLHTMTETENAFRMIVVKKDIAPVLPTIDEYLSKEAKEKLRDEIYYTIATNDTQLDAQEILRLHRQRGETSENKIKELKNGFNMSYLPTSNFDANSFLPSRGT